MRLPYLHKRKSRPGFTIRLRHPLRGGRVIVAGVGTTDPTQLARISVALTELVKNPVWHNWNKEAEARRLFPAPAVRAFYRRSLTEKQAHQGHWVLHYADDDSLGPTEVRHVEELGADYERSQEEIALLRSKVAILEQALRTGQRPGAWTELTVQHAYEEWCQNLTCQSQRERSMVLARVGRVVGSIKSSKVADLTAAQIIAAVSGSMTNAKSEIEKSKRTRDVKRMLRWVADHYGLDLRAVLAALHYASPQTLYRRREKAMLDRKALLAFLREPSAGRFRTLEDALYWRALVAVLACGGLRLSELAALRWKDVNAKGKLLDVVDTEIHELKNIVQQRCVRPVFPRLFWPLLNRLRMLTGSYALVFPRMPDGVLQNGSWLVRDKDKLIARPLTFRLRKLKKVIGLGDCLPLRARRFCQTEMLCSLPEHVVNLMLGHSAEVGRSHYVNVREVVLRTTAG